MKFSSFLRTAALLLVLLISAGISTRAAAATPVPPSVTATAAISIDMNTGRIFYAKDMHRRLPMASTTKIMTALTAVSIAGFTMDEKATVAKADLVGEANMALRPDEQISLRSLLYGLLLNSGNDAAMTIARHMGAKLQGGGEPIDRFVAQMNANAQTWGLRNSHYSNPHGLDAADHYSSAFDLAIVGWRLQHIPALAAIVNTRQINAEGHSLYNINTFLKTYSGANGIKPGLTDAAGLCLVASAQKNGQTAIVVILNTADMHKDANSLMDYAFGRITDPADKAGVANADGTFSTALDVAIGTVKGDTLTPFRLGPSGKPLPDVSAATIIGAAAAPGFPQSKTGNLGGGPQIADLQTTPDVATTPGATGGVITAPTTTASGGPNFLIILLALVVIAAIVYFVARQGLLGAPTQDRAVRVGDAVRHNVSRTREAISSRARSTTSTPPAAKPAPRPPTDDNSPPRQPTAQPQTHREGSPDQPVRPSVQVQPRQLEATALDRAPLPPMPLRTAAKPAPTVEIVPRIETAAEPVTQTDTPKAAPKTTLGEQVIDEVWLENRARQAIAYTAAGRYQAGFDEFRRVVENAPLFDFGSMPEFADMSLVGYRALAQAYLHVGRTKFAVLLLEMAIERYPNDLELRTGLRNLKKELGAQ